MLAPKLRFPEFTDAWEQRKLGDEVVEILAGGDIDKSKTVKNGKYPIYANALTNDGIVGYYDDYYRVKAPAVTVTGRGEVGFAQARMVDFTPVVRLLTIRSNHNCYFLENAINNHKAIVESTGVPQLTVPQLSSYKIYFPQSVEEETIIGNFLHNLNNLITFHQCKCDSMLEYKKGLLQKMFPKEGKTVPEVRFPGFDGAWEDRKLGELGNTYTGLSGKTKDDFGHGDAQYITYMNIFANPIIKSNGVDSIEIDNKQNKVKKGDIFFTTSSETPEEVGMASVLIEDYENTYLNSFCFGFRPTFEINSFFIAFLLRSPITRRKIEYLAQGSTRYNISKNEMLKLSLPFPSLEEQQKIGSFFKSLDEEIELQKQKIEQIKEYKKGLLQQMFV